LRQIAPWDPPRRNAGHSRGLFVSLARKNQALEEMTRLLRARKLFNGRCASIEERIFESVNRDKLLLNFVFPEQRNVPALATNH
jgi:hypothetical protein